MKKALLIHPAFSPYGFWNYGEVCRLVGASYPASPLGLITMAALLPGDWDLRLVDMNTRSLADADIDWADLVFVGGMLPQQAALLEIISRVHTRGRKVVVGGPDPTSQPAVYESADYRVLGEAERSMPVFLRALADGASEGTYLADNRPEMCESPVPRFDLLKLDDYMMIGIQFSRGCPFNCEFCDIIELYGRKPRTKSPQQVITELEALYALGYRGHIDLVDDNLIGHKGKAAEMLRAVLAWSKRHRFPFYFSTEASLNLADDDELLRLMQALDFRYVFIGIESPDNSVLKSTGKRTNLNRDIARDLHKIYRHGIVVNGGFIVGFDAETADSVPSMIRLIEDGNICMAMVGLLYALPNTQLRRRLQSEGRLLEELDANSPLTTSDVDQATSGINFVPRRPRTEVLEDLLMVIGHIYSTRNYFNRCLRLSKVATIRAKFKPSLSGVFRSAKALVGTVVKLGLRRSTAWFYWRNIAIILLRKPSSTETLINLMAMYIHFRRQSDFIGNMMGERLRTLSGTSETIAGLSAAAMSGVMK